MPGAGSGLAIRRIRKELKRLWTDPPAFCRPGPAPVTDLFHWEVVIDGPAGSPYAGGTFPVDVAYPKSYPFKPIKLTFKTKVYHPNICPEEGKMAVDILGSEWRPSLSISTVLLSVVSVLYDPLLDLPVFHAAARLYKRERGLFEDKARDWTRRYASAPVASFVCPAGTESETFEEAAAAASGGGTGTSSFLWSRAMASLRAVRGPGPGPCPCHLVRSFTGRILDPETATTANS